MTATGPVCRCGFQLPEDHPPAVIEHQDAPGTFSVIWNLRLCDPCARGERLEANGWDFPKASIAAANNQREG